MVEAESLASRLNIVILARINPTFLSKLISPERTEMGTEVTEPNTNGAL